MLTPTGVKIWRPRQLYLGSGEREYVEVKDRKEKADSTVFDAPTEVGHGGDSKRNELATYKDGRGEVLRPKL
jgi:citrate synthase